MKPQTKKKIDNLLISVKLRRTDQRRIILDILMKAQKPQTADEILMVLSSNSMNRVTVYRILESMVAAGIVHKAFLHKRAEYYELANHCSESQCHPHFTCTSCGSTHCLTEMLLPQAKGHYKGFIIKRQQVRFEGLCPECS